MKREFTLEGSIPLREAFLKEAGLTGKISTLYAYTFVDTNKRVGITDSKRSIHFILPGQWNDAVKFIADFDKEEEIVIDGETAEFRPLSVHFGCHELTLDELRAMKTVMNLCSKFDYDYLTLSDEDIYPEDITERTLTLEVIDKLIARLTKK